MCFLSIFKQKLSLLGKTIAAVNRTVCLRLEGNFGFAAAGRAGSSEHFSRAGAAVFTGIAAGLASLRFVLEAFLSVEVLFARGEDKFCAAVFANEGLVLIHYSMVLF